MHSIHFTSILDKKSVLIGVALVKLDFSVSIVSDVPS